jgi:hypothetical protein
MQMPCLRILAAAFLTSQIDAQAQAPYEARGPLLDAAQIAAAAGSESAAAEIVRNAIAQDAVRRFTNRSQASDVALVDSQWQEQWVPKTGVRNAADSRRVTFIRMAAAEAAAYYQHCGHLLLLRGFARVDNSLTVQIVDESLCSSSGTEMTFMNIDGHWRLDGEPHGFGDVRSSCGCP